MVAVMSVGIIHHAQVPPRSEASSALPLTEGSSAVELSPGALPPDPRLALEALRDASWVEGAAAPSRELALDFVDRIYEQMSDREIIEELAAQTEYTLEQLEQVRDLRAFLKRNVEIALALPGAGAEGEAPASVVSEIDFGRRVTLENTTRNPSSTFGSETRKIYAAFPSEKLVAEQVTVVWRDLSRAKILLYQRQPVSVDDAHSFVWIDRSDAWPPGDYSVEIYTGDEAMEPIALGTYSVTRN